MGGEFHSKEAVCGHSVACFNTGIIKMPDSNIKETRQFLG